MLQRLSLRLGFLALAVAAVSPLATNAQSQDSQNPSVAEAARRARELKKKSDKPAPVITEDTLKPAAPGSSGNAATSAPADNSAPSQAAPTDAPAAGASAPGAEDALKQQLAQAQSELELSQRELALQQDSYFSNPDHVHDKAGKTKVDAIQQQVNDKQQAVERLKMQLAASQELQGRSKAAPSAPSSEKPAAPPQP